jgi:hypothetical protein
VNIGDQRLVFNLQRQKQLDFDKLAKTWFTIQIFVMYWFTVGFVYDKKYEIHCLQKVNLHV